MKIASVRLAEADVLALLRARYCDPRSGGNGGEYAFFTQVRSDVSAGRGRTCDALAMGLWPSRGLLVHGHEVKVSRSDWLSELRKPAKADVWFALVNCWWLVVSDAEIVQPSELPAGWGLMAPARGKLKVLVEPARREIESLPHSFVAALMRKLAEKMQSKPDEVMEAHTRGYEAGQEAERLIHRYELSGFDDLKRRVADFERESGIRITDRWDYGAAEIGAALRMVLRGDDLAKTARSRLERLVADSRGIMEHVQRTLDQQDRDDLF